MRGNPKSKSFRSSRVAPPNRNLQLAHFDLLITERDLAESKLKASEERFEMIFKNLDVGIWSMNFPSMEVVFASPALEKLTGYSIQSFLTGEMPWSKLIHPDDYNEYVALQQKLQHGEMIQHQYRIMDIHGTIKWIEDKTFPVLNEDGHLIRLDGIVQDISERKRYEERINYLAFHDYLTELPNRRLFDQRLEELISNYQSDRDKFALFYLDMDRFKFVNDTLGHEIGDALLREISQRLSSIAGNKAVFRAGGDEFTIIQLNIDAMDPVMFGQEVIHEIEKPFEIEGYELHMTTSIGISIFPDNGETLKMLKMNADAALFRAKELGKNNVQLFTKSLNTESYKRFTLESDLRKAIPREEFILHYQPRVDTLTGEMVGAEALIRWNHPSLGLVSPGEFIPLAEETGVIHDMSDWVIRQVCQQLQEWKEAGYPLVPISINLSEKTLMKADIVEKIKRKLARYCISPSLIEIEITEDSLIKNEGTALATIQQLREMGLAIALDDFGTGYSSIGYLKKFKVDCIKIDRSFIKHIDDNIEDSTIVQSIILLAKGLRLKIVAEGVETLDQWEVLKYLNCHYIQGYLFSKPLPAERLAQLLRLEKLLPVPDVT
ncbi:putative bifunctional diguanylate cyclase/phosphodiesterase [Neobacillus jeddahensis]|uniref:putative bifunctional diguanylate cyclase/phosphodiesterase n=1 Tax=Neobacillus jeddahensis TaxID=1461580 RepID=UPI0006933B86|nr:GGDEF domain-containing phosphodiesterase [Neobacillus jeddahensis]